MAPDRTCVGCRIRRPAAQLVRVVADGAGGLAPGARAPGRGAWLCPETLCIEQAVRTRAFSRALRREVQLDDLEQTARLAEIIRIGGFEPETS